LAKDLFFLFLDDALTALRKEGFSIPFFHPPGREGHLFLPPPLQFRYQLSPFSLFLPRSFFSLAFSPFSPSPGVQTNFLLPFSPTKSAGGLLFFFLLKTDRLFFLSSERPNPFFVAMEFLFVVFLLCFEEVGILLSFFFLSP